MAGTLKLIFAGLPVRRATPDASTRIDHKDPVGSLVNPDAILLLPLGIHAERVVSRKPTATCWTAQEWIAAEKTAEHQEVSDQKNNYASTKLSAGASYLPQVQACSQLLHPRAWRCFGSRQAAEAWLRPAQQAYSSSNGLAGLGGRVLPVERSRIERTIHYENPPSANGSDTHVNTAIECQLYNSRNAGKLSAQ